MMQELDWEGGEGASLDPSGVDRPDVLTKHRVRGKYHTEGFQGIQLWRINRSTVLRGG